MYANIVKAPKRRGRRRHSEEFKREVIEACLQPGVSMAAVALANGLNANLVRRWVKERGGAESDFGQSDEGGDAQPPTLVPVTVAPIRRSRSGANTPVAAPMSLPDVSTSGEIKIEICREQTVVQVTWPVSEATACAHWLREVLR